MPTRTKEERLFGAACLKAQLEKSGSSGSGVSSIYQGTLKDLGLSDEEVTLFLDSQRDQVEEALAKVSRKNDAKMSS
jgi:hypothetical protein